MQQAAIHPHPEYVIVLTTLPPDHDAAGFARALVEERLAACVNIWSEMESVYCWKDRIERDRERQIVIKTRAARVEAVIRRIEQLHPYEVPEVLVIPVLAGSERYLGWVSVATEEPNADSPGR
jgi:periplasmic divalent cation tolerance protein